MMTQEEQYNLLLREVAELIKSKNDEISLLRWQVADLEAKLRAAEESKHE